MKAYVFPGQGAQFVGMGKDLYETDEQAKALFHQANEVLGFDLSKIMFDGSEEELKQTKYTQPAIFVHSIIKAKLAGEQFRPDAVAGHSLGEFSALVAASVLPFENGLDLVQKRAEAMQKACDLVDSTMAAIVGLDDEVVEEVCNGIEEVVVPANYNCPGQLVISGSVKGVEKAVELLQEKGAKRAVILPVGGAFHSPLMEPAKQELRRAIDDIEFKTPDCPIYQNVNALASTAPASIKQNLIDQLTAPVRWTQTVKNMINDGVDHFTEVGGKGSVLRGLIRRVDRKLPTDSI